MVRLFLVMIAGFGVGLVALIVGFGAGAYLTYQWMTSLPLIDPPRVNYQTLDFPSSRATIYLAAQSWGVTGNSAEVKICTSPVQLGVDGTCLKFYTPELFYGRSGDRGLVVYAYRSAIPNYEVTKLGDLDIKVHELDNDKHELMRRDYDKRGLMRIYAP